MSALTRVVLAPANLDNDPANNRLANLRGLCQRCHMLHDRPFDLAQRWLTYRRRWAIGNLFFGRYGIQPPTPMLLAAASRASTSSGRAHIAHDSRTGGLAFADWYLRQGGRSTTVPRPAEDPFRSAC